MCYVHEQWPLEHFKQQTKKNFVHNSMFYATLFECSVGPNKSRLHVVQTGRHIHYVNIKAEVHLEDRSIYK